MFDYLSTCWYLWCAWGVCWWVEGSVYCYVSVDGEGVFVEVGGIWERYQITAATDILLIKIPLRIPKKSTNLLVLITEPSPNIPVHIESVQNNPQTEAILGL